MMFAETISKNSLENHGKYNVQMKTMVIGHPNGRSQFQHLNQLD